MDNELQELIEAFLCVNPEPSDKQFHMLADAVGVDHEELEAIAYRMLADEDDTLDDADEFEIHADSQDVLEDLDGDPDNMPLSDVALNDGDVTTDDLGLQEETTDDGTDVHDIGIGLMPTDSVLTDDGAPAFGGA